MSNPDDAAPGLLRHRGAQLVAGGALRRSQGLPRDDIALEDNWLQDEREQGTALVTEAPESAARLARREQRAANTRSFIKKATSERTKHEYKKHFRAFKEWCAAEHLDALPALPDTVADYICDRALCGTRGRAWKPATIDIALAVIDKAHDLAGLRSPRHDVVVTEAAAGIRRALGVRPRRVAAGGVKVMRKLTAVLSDATTIGVRDRALLLLAFFGAFRRSELVALDIEDLSFEEGGEDDGMYVLLRRSKTDQEGKGKRKGIPFGDSPDTCPIRALRRWIEIAGIREGALFRSVNRHGRVGKRLLGGEVARIVKRTVAAAGLESSRYSGHSPRRGLTTDALKAGKSPWAVQRQGGWESTRMLDVYAEEAGLLGPDNAAKGLGL